MYCSTCGEEIPDDSEFCSHCGEPVSTPEESNYEGKENEVNSDPREDSKQVQWRDILSAVVLALLPALGAEIIVLYLLFSANGGVFFLTLLGFTYLFYQVDSVASMAGRMCFWLGVEALLIPLALFGYGFRSSETVLVVLIWIIVGSVVAVPVAGVLYLISRRLGG